MMLMTIFVLMGHVLLPFYYDWLSPQQYEASRLS